MQLSELRSLYRLKKADILKKQKEFERIFKCSDEDIFLELCFCILAAGTSARLALDTVEKIKDKVFTADAVEMQRTLKQSRYRFHTLRAGYIIATRNYLNEDCGFNIKNKISSFTDPFLLREYFAENKGIKGIAYKEGSHFLRNIGFKGYAILDKHVVNTLFQLGAIKSDKKPSGKKSYLALEETMKEFANDIDIDFDELDLLLWCSKTGEIIK